MKTLKNVLLMNAVSSGMTGLLLIVLPKTFAEIFKVPQTGPFVATGLFLLLFSLLVGYAAAQKAPHGMLVKWIIALDSLWVTASLGILLLQPFALSGWGNLLIGGVAAWVALMAYLQRTGLTGSRA